MAFKIFADAYQTYSGDHFSELDGGGFYTGGAYFAAAPTAPSLYNLQTTGIAGVILLPLPDVTRYQYQAGINGVLTHLQFTPAGSIQGASVSVEERVGAFAYYQEFLADSKVFLNDLIGWQNRNYDISVTYNYVVTEVNYLLSAARTSTAVSSDLASQVAGLASGGFTDLATDVQTFASLATKWETPLYFLNLGSGFTGVSESSINFGINLTTANGATSTWAVNGAAGTVTVSGYTALGFWNGDPNSVGSAGRYNIVNADTDGYLDVSSFGATHNQVLSVSGLVANGFKTNLPNVTQYALWDTGSGGAHLLLNGVVQPSQQSVFVTPGQLALAQYQSGAGPDVFWVQAYNGSQVSGWQSFTITGPIDTGPVETVSNRSVAHDQVLQASSLFTYSDPFGRAATQYDFWNTGTDGGQFLLNGLSMAINQDNIVSAAQLSSVTYHPGSGSDTLWVRANSGEGWGAWSQSFTVAAPIDIGPVETVHNITAAHGQAYAASSMFTYSDPFNSPATKYDFWNKGDNGGHFEMNGVSLGLNQDIIISAPQLSMLNYHSGSGADTLWVRANDGTVWGAWSQAFTVTAPIDTGPVLTVTNHTVAHGQSLLASSLFTYSDPFGSPATQYDFFNTGGDAGHFAFSNGGALGGTNQHTIVDAQELIADPNGLGHLIYQSGSGTDTLWVRANDGTTWGAWSQAFTVTAPVDKGPVETVSNLSVAHGQALTGASLFTYNDPFGNPATTYDFWNTGTGGGHFTIGGGAVGANQDNIVSAANLSAVTYQSGSGADTLWVRANDGTVWGAWSHAFSVTAPTDSAPVVTAFNFNALPNQTVAAASLFSVADAEHDVISKYQFWDSTAATTSGHWSVAGLTQGTNTAIDISAAQLAATSFQGGTTPDDLWVRANDGMQWGAWQEFHWLV
ncbi:hypothetical protein ACVWYH_007221 [Bradyrhizobium sp. GM24.11]